MSVEEYDAIVVGSGISGGWAAKELCEKGLTTLVLERGPKLEHVQGYTTAHIQPWEFENRGIPSQKDRVEHPIQSQGYAFSEATRQYWVKDIEHPYTAPEDQPYHWIRGYHVGGRSITWARQCYRLSDLDFEANQRDGVGIDWPIRYADIESWYSYVEKFVGISGNRDNIPVIPDGEFLPPMDMTAIEKYFKEQLEKRWPDRKLVIGRSANLTAPLDGRGVCQFRGTCQRGCPRGAYFSSQSATLPAAAATGKMVLRPDSVVESVLINPDTGKASGVRVVDARSGQDVEYRSKVVFLCASTLGSTWILLNSKSEHFPNGLANSSGTLGKYLMDHHYHAGAEGESSALSDRTVYGRRPNNIYIPRFRNVSEKYPGFLRGYGYQGTGDRMGWWRGSGSPGFGKEFKERLARPGPWTFSLNGFGETLPYADNMVALDEEKRDIHGLPTLRISAKYYDNEFAMRKDMTEQAGEMLEASGFKNVKQVEKTPIPGSCVHEMGTARMGRDPKTSVLNKWNQAHDVPNLFVTDGACMTSSACQNPSLTYMALTARAVDYAVEALKRRDI